MRVLAIDIGASSGRHMLGSVENGKLTLEEVYRFPNGMSEKNGRLCWDYDALWGHILAGMKECAARGTIPDSVGVDTWGVDYALVDGKGDRVGDCVAYRDSRTQGADERMEKTMPFAELYRRTGIAKQPFNTVYQLMTEPPEALVKARRVLLAPDYFHYLLSGVQANEYTDASTGALLDVRARTWDTGVLEAAGIPARLFPDAPVPPGTRLGRLRPEVAREVGFDCDVITPASHDTGSAYMAVPARGDDAAYLSSGTWSLLGVESDAPVTTDAARESGFTNEGGYGGKIRLLRNIMGLWILQCVRRELGERYSFAEMADMAESAKAYGAVIDVSDQRFLAPKDMIGELKAALREINAPEPSTAELLACVNHSLAECYAKAVRGLETVTGKRYTSLNIVGGGSKSRVLNQWTANATGLPVYAGPGEGTALGNVIAQLIAGGAVEDLARARRMIRDSFEIEEFLPERQP